MLSSSQAQLTGGLVLGLSASHWRPVSSSTAESMITSTSALDWDELASTTGAICSKACCWGLCHECMTPEQQQRNNQILYTACFVHVCSVDDALAL